MVSNEEIKQKLDSKRGIKKSDEPKKDLLNEKVSNEEIKRRLKNRREGRIIDKNKIDTKSEESERNAKSQETGIATSANPPQPLNKSSTKGEVQYISIKTGNKISDIKSRDPADSKQKVLNSIYSQMEEPQMVIKSQKPFDRICDKCGHQSPLMSIFCENCGEKLPSIKDAHEMKNKTIKKQGSSLNNSLQNQKTPEALLGEGSTLLYKGKYDDALKKFDLALTSNPNVPTRSLLLYNKGLVLKKIDERGSEGNECLKEFIRIAPSNLKDQKKIAEQLIRGKLNIDKLFYQLFQPRRDVDKIVSGDQNAVLARFNLQIRETTIGTFGHHQENFDTAIVELALEELRIIKKGIFTGRDRGNITLKYMDMISIDEDRGWVLTTVQIRMAGNHTVNLRANKEGMRNFFTVLKQAVDTCKERERTRETKARQINNEPKINTNNISEDPVDKLVKLAKLLENGLIDENEFATLKADILKKE